MDEALDGLFRQQATAELLLENNADDFIARQIADATAATIAILLQA